MDAFNLVTDVEYFGHVDDALVERFRNDLATLFPEATLFKLKEKQEADLTTCIQHLSITTASAAVADLSDKMSSVNL